jgi:DNA polymerase III subunit beta
MRLSVPRSLLSEHVQSVAKAVPGKSTIPSLEGILFESDGETLTMTATNLEMGIRTSFTAAHEEPGRVVLPGKVVEIIRRLPADSVQLIVNSENFLTEIRSGPAEFQLYGLDAADFPAFTAFSPEMVQLEFSVKTGDLRRALRQTLFAVSTDEGKPAFTGLLFSLQENVLILSASDTFRLATTRCAVQNNGSSGDFLVPARNLHEILRLYTQEEETIQIRVAQNQVLLQCGTREFSSRLLDENFPNVERVIPREFSGRADVDVEHFMQAVERASLLSEGSNHVVRLSVGQDVMVVRAASKYGKTQEQVPLKLEGEGLEVSLNSRYILDMLKMNEGDRCIMEITGPNKPCILRDSLYEEYLYLVLPIKI